MSGNIMRDFAGFQAIMMDGLRRIPKIAGVTAVMIFKENFEREGFLNNEAVKKWDKRKRETRATEGHKILYGQGDLANSPRYIVEGPDAVRIGSDLPYAAVHNEGGIVTANIGEHERKITVNKKKGKKIVRVQKHIEGVEAFTTVDAHSRTTDMPQRQFIGESTDVIEAAEKEIWEQLEEEIRRLS